MKIIKKGKVPKLETTVECDWCKTVMLVERDDAIFYFDQNGDGVIAYVDCPICKSVIALSERQIKDLTEW